MFFQYIMFLSSQRDIELKNLTLEIRALINLIKSKEHDEIKLNKITKNDKYDLMNRTIIFHPEVILDYKIKKIVQFKKIIKELKEYLTELS